MIFTILEKLRLKRDYLKLNNINSEEYDIGKEIGNPCKRNIFVTKEDSDLELQNQAYIWAEMYLYQENTNKIS